MRNVTVVFLLIATSALGAAAAERKSAQESIARRGWNLTTRGVVKVDGQPAVSGVTVSAGQIVSTDPDGVAMISVPGRGTIFIAPKTTVKIVGDGNKFALLFGGTAGVNSFISGELAIGGETYSVVPDKTSATTYQIEQGLSGPPSVFCLNGSVKILSATGTALLTAGDMAKVTPNAPVTVSGNPVPTGRSRRPLEYILLAVGAAGGLGAAALLEGHAMVSPSSP